MLGGAFVLRMILAGVTEGYPYDMSCFVAWGEKLLADGPAGFYSGGYFADYPPGYLFVLGFVALVRQIFAIPYEAGMTYVLLAVVPSLCDCAAAALVWHIGREKLPESRLPLLLAAFVAFDPLLLFDTAVWKQIDGAFALPLLLCFYLLEKRRYLPAAVLYGVALAIKPQALLFGPVLAVCFLAAIVQEENRFRAFLRCFGGAALALFPPLALGLPYFGLTNLLPKLLEKQDYEIQVATLNERNRIAREIHDSVGHLLSRSILQLGALKAVHRQEPELNAQLDTLKSTLSQAMDSIRESVHDLHEESIDLRSQLETLCRGFTFCPPGHGARSAVRAAHAIHFRLAGACCFLPRAVERGFRRFPGKSDCSKRC